MFCLSDTNYVDSWVVGFKLLWQCVVLLQFSNIQVTRRYKQFDWLHQRLTDKFTTIAIPPLPGKQVTGLVHQCVC